MCRTEHHTNSMHGDPTATTAYPQQAYPDLDATTSAAALKEAYKQYVNEGHGQKFIQGIPFKDDPMGGSPVRMKNLGGCGITQFLSWIFFLPFKRQGETGGRRQGTASVW